MVKLVFVLTGFGKLLALIQYLYTVVELLHVEISLPEPLIGRKRGRLQLDCARERSNCQRIILQTQIAQAHQTVAKFPFGVQVQFGLQLLDRLVIPLLAVVLNGLFVVCQAGSGQDNEDSEESYQGGKETRKFHLLVTPPAKPAHIATSEFVGMETFSTRSCLHRSSI